MAGVEITGFVKKTLADLLAEIEAAERADISPSLNLQGDSVFGQLNGVFAEKLREGWDVSEAVYNSFNPDLATGASLDALAAITGAIRSPATKSTVTVTCTGTPATFLPAGRVVSVTGTGDRFASVADATIGGGGTVEVEFESEEFGPIAAPAATLTVIETPVAGWTSATNGLDADPGSNIETDVAFRQRRIALLRVTGSATVEAIRSQILTVTSVLQAFVFENTSFVVDADGLPPKSFEAVVSGGDEQEIADIIWLNKAAGIETFGTVSKTVVDTQTFSHTIKFSRPVDKNIWIDLTLLVDGGVFGGGSTPAGEANVKQLLVDRGDQSLIGEDVLYLLYNCIPLDEPGVLDVTAFFTGFAAAPTGEVNLAILIRELAKFDTSRITITTVAA
jgi:uncharacterized phage protein gp47/JayE